MISDSINLQTITVFPPGTACPLKVLSNGSINHKDQRVKIHRCRSGSVADLQTTHWGSRHGGRLLFLRSFMLMCTAKVGSSNWLTSNHDHDYVPRLIYIIDLGLAPIRIVTPESCEGLPYAERCHIYICLPRLFCVS